MIVGWQGREDLRGYLTSFPFMGVPTYLTRPPHSGLWCLAVVLVVYSVLVWFKILDLFAGFDRVGHGVLLRRRRLRRPRRRSRPRCCRSRGTLVDPDQGGPPLPPGSVRLFYLILLTSANCQIFSFVVVVEEYLNL